MNKLKVKYFYFYFKDFELNLTNIGKILDCHQAPIKSIKFLYSEKEKILFIIAGSYDQIISITKFDTNGLNYNSIPRKFKICLAELNCLDCYLDDKQEKIVIYAVGQGLEKYEYLY